MKTAQVILLALIVGSLQSNVDAGVVTLADVNIYTISGDGFYSFQSDHYFETTIPATVTRSVNPGSGGSSAITVIDFSETSEKSILQLDFDHMRAGYTGLSNSFAGTNTGFLDLFRFSVSQDVEYDLSGSYTVFDSGNTPGRVDFNVWIIDQTLGATVTKVYQRSDTTLNESFSLSSPGGGDTSNSTIGSLSGTLLANHVYDLRFESVIIATPGSQEATANGNVTLEIGYDSSPVPEPSSIALLGIGIASIFGFGCRRRPGPLNASQAT